MMTRKLWTGAAAAALLVTAGSSNGLHAQPPAMPVPRLIPAPESAGEIPLYPAGAPRMAGAAEAERWNAMGSDVVVRNVVTPTIKAYLPKPGTATGAAVLVAPGGGFMLLSIRNEGWDVAQWLADHGVAAFVLKYRVNPTPADEAAFDEMGRKMMAGAMRPPANGAAPPPPPPTFQPAVDDGVAALRLIRSRAAEWKIDPARLGMIGFSAGAMNTLSVALAQQEGAKPAFIGLIYGPMTARQVPADAPPLFAALAADDPLFARSGTGLLTSWAEARRPVEFHMYQKGGHGFGMLRNGTTTELWPEEFLAWLRVNRFVPAPG